MRKSRKKQSVLSPLDGLFLLGAGVFLASAVLRIYGPPELNGLRERAAAFVTGDFSAHEIVQAFGDWETLDEPVAAVFRAVDFSEAELDAEGAVQTSELALTAGAEGGFEQDILAGRASLFPDTVDRTAYLIDLPCKTPTEGIVSSAFGARTDPIDGEEGYHYGLDIAAEEGKPIYAVAAGTVQETGNNSYGNYVIVDHGNGLQSLYAHCSEVLVEAGDTVADGAEIARVGMTGRATGNHLHFELWRAGKILDPTGYLEV